MANDKRFLLFNVLLTFTWIKGFDGETVLGAETDEFDFDGLPGALHEFKVEVAAGREECFYQKISAGGKMHVSFEVIEGDHITAIIKSYEDRTLDAQYDKTDGVLMIDAQYTGAYAICLDNTLSMMSSKLVYIYMVTYVQEEWDKYTKDLEDLHLTMVNFTHILANVGQAVTNTRVHQAQIRMHVMHDWHVISNNNTYVFRWSLFQCVVTIASACLQVYFVRRLFRTHKVTPSQKPRA